MQTVKGLVSISIPFYNSARFLQETIESVLAQTYTAWELLLVDDGSTDMSTRIALNFSSQLPDKIIYLEHGGHRNRGLTCSRNLAAMNSRGEYLAFLDSDDVWFAHKLQEQVSILNSDPEVEVVFGLSEYWYDWEKGVGKTQTNWVPPLAPGGSIYYPPSLLSRSYPLGAYGSPCPSSIMIRRRAFDRLGAFEESFNPDTHQLYEDIAFLAKVYSTVPVYVSGTCWG